MSNKPYYTACYVEGRVIVTRHQSSTSQTVAILHQNTQLMLSGDKIIQLPSGKNGPEKVAVIDVPDAANILDAMSTAHYPDKTDATPVFMKLLAVSVLITVCVCFGMYVFTPEPTTCEMRCLP